MQTAIYELNQLRGARVDSPLAIPPVDLTLRALPPVATLLFRARDHNYDVRTRVLELEQQGYKVRLALNERWPAVRVGPVPTMNAPTLMNTCLESAPRYHCRFGIQTRARSNLKKPGPSRLRPS